MSIHEKWNKPWIIGLLYALNIVTFALLYWLYLSYDFKDRADLNFTQALYFSIVTVTTLGFGDIIPNLSSNRLLICIIIQVVLGVLNIGLFLNSISNKISLNKEKELKEKAEAINSINVAKILTILRPIVIDQLNTLSDIYKSTSLDNSNRTFEIAPHELINDAYFDQVCLIDYFSTSNKYGNNMKFAEILIQENDKFQSDIESFLGKFAYALDIEVVYLINEIQKHRYFEYPKQAMMFYRLGRIEPRHMISLEHSARITSNHDLSLNMRDFHSKLLKLIEIINKYLPKTEIMMRVSLVNHVSPPVGSARARMFYWGSEDAVEIDNQFETILNN